MAMDELIKREIKPCYDSDGAEGKYRVCNKNILDIHGRRLGKGDYCLRYKHDTKEEKCPRTESLIRVPGPERVKKFLCGSREDHPWPDEDTINLIILPGEKNTGWGNDTKELLKFDFGAIKAVSYNQWDMSIGEFDLDFEMGGLQSAARSLDNYCILGYSEGAALCLKGINERRINPKKCVLVGLPAVWAAENDISLKNLLQDYRTPTLFVQNFRDPQLGSEGLLHLLERNEVYNHVPLVINNKGREYSVRQFKKELVEFCRK